MVSLARSCECLEPSQDRLRLDADYFNTNDDHYSSNAYIKNITQSNMTMLTDLENRHNGRESFSPKLPSSEVIYNLTDVGKFLPKIDEKNPEVITRKRKERQDSGSSLLQDCKVIRSNSEERQIEVKSLNADNIRRVSSHEDFEKCKKPFNRVLAIPLHEQNYDSNNLLIKSPSQSELNADYLYMKDHNVAIDPGEKYSNILFGQNVHNASPPHDSHNLRFRYSKSDSSPSRSRIHEYILFPKRISPNRDPNAGCGGNIYSRGGWGSLGDGERDHERLRCSERRSRTVASRGRRLQQRRQLKYRLCDDKEYHPSKVYKENDSTCFERYSNQKENTNDEVQAKNEENCLKNNDISISLPFTSRDRLEQLVDFNRTEVQKKREPYETNYVDVSQKTTSKEKSPVLTSSMAKQIPLLDFKSLHEQLGTSEPVPSMPTKYSVFPWMIDDNVAVPIDLGIDTEPLLDDNVGGYNKEIISEIRSQIRTLPEKCQIEKPEAITGYPALDNEERINRLSKKIQSIKKKISKCETEFESTHGFKVSHSDKSNDRHLSKLYSEVRRLKSERKTLKASFTEESLSRPIPTSSGEPSLKNKPISEIMVEIEKRLEVKREVHGRPTKLEDCTHVQLAEEKAAVQRALLWLEGARGRPTDRADRDAVRPLYDRYRAVKRLVAKFDAMKLNSSTGELATILENETMLFNTLDSPSESPEATKRQLSGESTSYKEDSASEKKDIDDPTSSSAKSTASEETNIILDENTSPSNENLHCMSLSELSALLNETKALKASLRKKIKSLEADYEIQNSKKLLKEEKLAILPMYNKYKETKARLRLLSALVNKQKKV